MDLLESMGCFVFSCKVKQLATKSPLLTARELAETLKGRRIFVFFFQQEVPPTKMTSTDENDHLG